MAAVADTWAGRVSCDDVVSDEWKDVIFDMASFVSLGREDFLSPRVCDTVPVLILIDRDNAPGEYD